MTAGPFFHAEPETPPDAPPAAVTGPLLDALQTAWGIIANAYEGDWNAAQADWREAAERWRDTWHTLLAEHLRGVIATPLADEQVVTALLETGLVSRALAEALAEIICTVRAANSEARLAWAKHQQQAHERASLEDELAAFRTLAAGTVLVRRDDLRDALTGYEILTRTGASQHAAEAAQAKADVAVGNLWEAMGEHRWETAGEQP